MLKIAKSVEYALFAIKYIHESGNRECVSVKEISDSMNIPYELLAKIMQRMVKNGIITSQHGTNGGYILNNKPEAIFLGQVVGSLGLKIQMTDCLVHDPSESDCARFRTCCLRSPISKIQDKINLLFDNTTVQELI